MHETETSGQENVQRESSEPTPLVLPGATTPAAELPKSRGVPAYVLTGLVILILSCLVTAYWSYTLNQKLKKSETDRLNIFGAALSAISVEFRVAHYSLQSFLESGDPGTLPEVKAVLGPAVRVASKVLVNVDNSSSAADKSYIEAVSSAASRLSDCVDLIMERTRYYGRIQDLDRRVIEKLMPKLLSLADATTSQPAAAPMPGPRVFFTASDRQLALSSAKSIQTIADEYLTLGVMPEQKPPAKITATAAADVARKSMKLSQDYVYKSATEHYSKWLGTHYWEVLFSQGDRVLRTFVNAETGKFAGFIKPDHTIIHKGEMPSMTRGEALAKARTILGEVPQLPQDLVVGPVEFTGTWKVTFWPKVGGVVYYSHPVVVWVDAKSNQPYGIQYLRQVLRPSMPIGIDQGYATSLAKKMAEKGWMKEAFKQYRGSTYLAVYRSPLTAEDTLVWAVEFVISSRFHENTGYDMAIVLINAKDGRYEGYKGLGDGPWRVDRWQTK